ESLFIERRVVAAAQIAVRTKNEHRLETGGIRAADLQDVPRQLTGGGVTLATDAADQLQLFFIRSDRNAFGEHANPACILPRAAITADDVVIQNGFDVPPRLPGHPREVFGAVESLFLPCHREK